MKMSGIKLIFCKTYINRSLKLSVIVNSLCLFLHIMLEDKGIDGIRYH